MHLRRRSLRPRAIRAALPLLPLLALATAVTGVAGAGSAFAASSASSSAAPARPDLAVVEMTVDPGEIPAAGGNVEVKIAVRNAGSGPASNVTVKVRPPAGTTRAIDYEYPPPRSAWRTPRTPRVGSATTTSGDARTWPGPWPRAVTPRSSTLVCTFRPEAPETGPP